MAAVDSFTRKSRRSRTGAAGSGPRRRRRYLREPVPWRRLDLLVALALAVIGLAVLALGYWAAAGEVRLREQEIWVCLAIFGTAIAALGGVWLVTIALREVALARQQVLADIAEVMGWSVGLGRRGRLVIGDPDRTDPTGPIWIGLVSAPEMTLAHRPECPIARNKPVVAVSAAQIAERGLAKCGMCAR